MENGYERKSPGSGTSVYSNRIFVDLIKDTDFERDERIQLLLDSISIAFVDLIKTEHGTFILQSLEGTIKSIKDGNGFRIAIQLTSQVVQEINLTTEERFALFLGCVGIIVALVSHHGPATTVSAEIEKMISKTNELILCTVILPLRNGTTRAIENFFACEFVAALND